MSYLMAVTNGCSDVWAIGVITYFLLCGYTPFDRDSNLEEMQAILVADYSFTPIEYWRHVSTNARTFIQRCLTIDPTMRITAHQALSHPWITGEDEEEPSAGAKRNRTDLLPTVKKNFNARRTLHAAIDTIRAINQLRASGATGMAANKPAVTNDKSHEADGGAMEDVVSNAMPQKENVDGGEGKLGNFDPRGNARGQSEHQIKEQARRVGETVHNLWEKRQ